MHLNLHTGSGRLSKFRFKNKPNPTKTLTYLFCSMYRVCVYMYILYGLHGFNWIYCTEPIRCTAYTQLAVNLVPRAQYTIQSKIMEMNWIVCNCVDEWNSTFNNKTSAFDRRQAHFRPPHLCEQTLYAHTHTTTIKFTWSMLGFDSKPFFIVVVVVVATIDDDDDGGSGDRRTTRKTRSFLKFNICLWVCLMHTHTEQIIHRKARSFAHTHTYTDNPQFTTTTMVMMMIYSVVV